MDRENQAVRLSGPSDDQLRLIIDNVPAMIWTARPNGFRDFFNRPWLDYTGLSLGEAVGSAFVAMHGEDRPEFTAQWERAVQSGTAMEREARLRRADGEFFWFLHRIVPFRDASGKIVKWFATATDIHSFKESEQGIRQREDRLVTLGAQLEELFEQAPEGVALLDVEDRIVRTNREFTKIFGYEPDEVIGRPINDLIAPEELRWQAEAFTKQLLKGQRIDTQTIRCRKGGKRIHVSLLAVPISVPGGQIAEYALFRDITEQETVKGELTRRTAYLNELFERAPEALAEVDLQDLVVRVNPEFSRIFGYSSEEAVGRPMNELIAPGDLRAEAEDISERATRRGEILNVETIRARKDGSRFPVSLLGLPVHIDGKQVGTYGIYRDITDRKRAEDALRSSEERFRLIVETIPGLIAVQSAAGKLELVNRSLSQYFGKTLEELRAWETNDTVHPDDLPRVIAAWRHSVNTGEPYDDVHRIRRADGVYRWFHVRGHALRDPQGAIVRWYEIFSDIDDRKRAEDELRQSEAYLAEAQRLSQTGSWASNPATGEIRYWSEECFRVLGFDPRGPLPQFETFFQRIHPEDQASTRACFMKAWHDKADFEVDYRIVHPDKGVRDIHVVSRAVLDRSGELLEFVGTVIDVTERKRAQEELQQLVDFVPQISAVVSPDDVSVRFNRVGREYTGLSRGEHQAADVIQRLIHPDDLEKMRAIRKRGMAGTEQFELEARFLGKDGIYRWFLFRYNPLVEEGRVRRWYATGTEIEARKQQEEQVRQEIVRLEERTRIARELHDTLLQTFLSASLQLGVAVDGLPRDSPAKPRLDRVLQLMDQGMEEGRNTIQALRSSDSGSFDLVLALSRVQQEVGVHPEIDFRVIVAGRQQPLRQPIGQEIYRIGKEALVNAFRHSRAKRVEFELEYADSDLRVRVRDNGCGIDPQLLDAGRAGHWGLAGMRERATSIGGLLKITSNPADGTEVQLSIPSDLVFQLSPAE